jgi:hypothetical protein
LGAFTASRLFIISQKPVADFWENERTQRPFAHDSRWVLCFISGPAAGRLSTKNGLQLKRVETQS